MSSPLVADPHTGDKSPNTGPTGRQDLLPQVFGRYLLVQRLSRGGMGEIFLAKHGLAGFEKLAVIKKVLPHLSADASFISRFVDEAQVAIKLQHVNVAQVFEVGRVGTEYFLALEYVEGRDLRRTLALLAQRKQRIPVDLALFIGREMANGLAYAHRRTSADGASLRLVHCDISPPNVLVSFEGETKVIDFGIAKSAIRGTATDPKMGFGKFGYMAPEQLIRGGTVDHRTDIYAAGVVLFELVTGKRLYEAGDEPDYRALARKVAKGEYALPSQIDPQLAPYDDLVATALRPRMDDRYQSAAELRDAIQQSLVGINPTISTDQLGAYMRELFADEMAAQKELHERIAKAHLADFQDQLDQSTQSIGTVTFALANLPITTEEVTGTTPKPTRARRASVPPPSPGAGAPRAAAPTTPPRGITPQPVARRDSPAGPQLPPPTRQTPPPPAPRSGVTSRPGSVAGVQSPAASMPDLSLADGTGTVDQVRLGRPRGTRAAVIGVVSVVLVAGALVSWAMTRSSGTRSKESDIATNEASGAPSQSQSKVMLTVSPIETGSATAQVTGSNVETGSAVLPPPPPQGSDVGSATVAAPTPLNPPNPPHPPPNQQQIRHHPPVPPPPHHPPPPDVPKPPAITQQVVGAKFSQATREYRAYKEKFGMRLDAEWNDLAVWVQNHQIELDESARRIDAFRAKLH
jgi:serine/threonine protein kinase